MLSSIWIPLVRSKKHSDAGCTAHNTFFSEPVKLVGEGEYNLNVLKEIQVTESYLGLDQDIRNCQNEESLFKCGTREYIETFLAECRCLPFNIRQTDKVF